MASKRGAQVVKVVAIPLARCIADEDPSQVTEGDSTLKMGPGPARCTSANGEDTELWASGRVLNCPARLGTNPNVCRNKSSWRQTSHHAFLEGGKCG
jgi:hypothetical protein